MFKYNRFSSRNDQRSVCPECEPENISVEKRGEERHGVDEAMVTCSMEAGLGPVEPRTSDPESGVLRALSGRGFQKTRLGYTT